MAKGIPVDPKIKQQVINAVRHQGMSVSEAADSYDVSPKSIYAWLQEGVVDGSRNIILENKRLKKENEQLYKLLGRATAEMERSKK